MRASALGPCAAFAYVLGCGSAPLLAADPASSTGTSSATARGTGSTAGAPGDVTFAPQPAESLTPNEARWVAHCGKPDRALFAVARDLAAVRAAGGAMPPSEEITRRVRAAGAPYVWPAAVGLSGTATEADIVERLRTLRAQVEKDGEARCGFGLVDKPPANGFAASQVLVAIAVANVGTFEKLPLHAAPGQWLTATAHFPAGLRSGSAYLLGPSGTPRSVQTTLSSRKDTLTVRFAPEADGEYELQMLGDLGSGPRPLFEALVVAGKGNAPVSATSASAQTFSDDEAGVLTRINELRAKYKTKPLTLDAALSQVAVAHANDMTSAKKLAHDVGKGTPDQRVKRAGISLRVVGENVSYAKGVIAAHEGIERSPSHRANVLRAEFTKVGIGFVREADGMVYLAEVFGG